MQDNEPPVFVMSSRLLEAHGYEKTEISLTMQELQLLLSSKQTRQLRANVQNGGLVEAQGLATDLQVLYDIIEASRKPLPEKKPARKPRAKSKLGTKTVVKK